MRSFLQSLAPSVHTVFCYMTQDRFRQLSYQQVFKSSYSVSHVLCTRIWTYCLCYFQAYGVFIGRSERKRPLGRPSGRWEDNIKMHLQEVVGESLAGLLWLRIRTGGGRLRIRWWNFGFHKMRGISWLAEEVSTSQKGFWSLHLVWLVLKSPVLGDHITLHIIYIYTYIYIYIYNVQRYVISKNIYIYTYICVCVCVCVLRTFVACGKVYHKIPSWISIYLNVCRRT